MRVRSLSTLLWLCPSYSCRLMLSTPFQGGCLSHFILRGMQSLDSLLCIPFPKTGTCKSDAVKPHQHALLRMCPRKRISLTPSAHYNVLQFEFHRLLHAEHQLENNSSLYSLVPIPNFFFPLIPGILVS